MSSLLWQLIDTCGFLPEIIRSLYDHHVKRETRPSRLEILDLLHSTISGFSTIFIVADAVDERSEIDGRRTILLAGQRNFLPEIRLLCSSRYITDIERRFEGVSRLEVRTTDGDIRKHLESRIATETLKSRSEQRIN